MANVYLDDAALEIEDKDGNATIGDLIAAVNGELAAMKRFLVEVSADGQSVMDFADPETLKGLISRHGEVRLKSGSVEEIAHKGVEISREYVRAIRVEALECVEALRAGREGAGARLDAIVSGTVDVIKTVDSVARGLARHSLTVFKEGPAPYLGQALSHLDAIGKAGRSGDIVLVADILEYEFLPFLDVLGQNLLAPDASGFR